MSTDSTKKDSDTAETTEPRPGTEAAPPAKDDEKPDKKAGKPVPVKNPWDI